MILFGARLADAAQLRKLDLSDLVKLHILLFSPQLIMILHCEPVA